MEPDLDIAQIFSERMGEEFVLNERHLNPQLGRVLRTIGFDRTWVRGDGSYLIDDKGEQYLDMLAGYGVFGVGRNNRSIKGQLKALLEKGTANLPQMGVSLLAGVLAEQLLARAPERLGAVVLTSTGTEAVETAVKLARASTGRPRIIFCEHGFHGLTMGSLSVNGNPEFRDRFGPLLPGCKAIPFGDIDALAEELGKGDVAAFLVEPIQGKGVNIPPPGFHVEAQEFCKKHGALFAVDEIQTGLGRTGKFFALEHWGLEPDIVLASKALSGGYVPVGAALTTRQVFDAVFDRMERAVVHSSTFAGNDLAAAAGIATLAEIDDMGLVDSARRMGSLLMELTEPLVERFEVVSEVRGMGLMWAIEFGPPAGGLNRRVWSAIEKRQPGLFTQMIVVPLFKRHQIMTQVAGHEMNVIKATPPLTINEDEIRIFAEALDDVIGRLGRLPLAATGFGLSMATHAVGAKRKPRTKKVGTRRK